jgi:RNA polymerase sigma factor (sigma-70 family)
VRSDTDLLAAWREGDRGAGDELIRRHFASICRFFRSKLGDNVEDLVQRVFLDCVESRDRIGPDGFRPYLFATARNRLCDHLRRRYRLGEQVDLAAQSVADLGTSPSSALARNQEERLLLQALRALPLDQQILLELAYWEGMAGHEIAAVLTVAENTVRSRLSRARAALRERVERLAATPELCAATLRSLDERVAI